MGAGLLAVKSGFILFIKSYQFLLQINTLEREDGGVFQRGSARHVAVASIRGRHFKSAAYRYRGATRHVVAT
jgi:hypothetical protein